jgi:NADH:ubiquinone oxidoreductase subunit E
MSSAAQVQTEKPKAARPAVDLSPMPGILARYPREEPSLIQILQDVHRVYNYLPPEALEETARAIGVPLAKVYSVATFYKAFALEPQGKVIIKICTGTACHIRGAPQLVDELERELGVKPGGTTADMAFTVKTVNCVGACAMAPVIIVGGKYHGGAKATKVKTYLGRGKS